MQVQVTTSRLVAASRARIHAALRELKAWARMLKREVRAIYLATQSPRVPWYTKWLALAVAGYALSPIDLIPDFIPVLGYLDDLIIVPLGIWLVLSFQTYGITKFSEEGTVDWFTYSGFRRYHSDCHVCHGPNGEGSSYAPALATSLKTMNYVDFNNVVTNGRQNVNSANDKVMPSFATNSNVMCYLDDIYAYLRARAKDAIPGGRPPKHEDKTEAVKQAEASCTGIK
jgi:methanol metabolism-related c-type cytochrome